MADFERARPECDAAGTGLAAVSTDSPRRLAAAARDLGLGYPVLCDRERKVVAAWGLLDASRFGGIAVPAIIVVDSELRVRFASVDDTHHRVTAPSLLAWLRGDAAGGRAPAGARSRLRGDFWRALRLWPRR